LKTLGDHLRKKRLDLGIFQKEVAKILGTNMASILNWEKNRTDPTIDYIPRIIEFLDYVPFDSIADMSLGEKIITCRKIKGISQKELAQQLGFDPGTVAQWECNHRVPSGSYLEALSAFLNPIISGT
jgi:transcriptional regulator with XRE-family HTH domain